MYLLTENLQYIEVVRQEDNFDSQVDMIMHSTTNLDPVVTNPEDELQSNS